MPVSYTHLDVYKRQILLRIAPPVMLAQLIQALYNIVDSYFVGQYSNSGLTALSVIFPVQLIITAIAVGKMCIRDRPLGA